MSEQGLQRPRQVTVSGGIGLVGCLVLVVGLFDAMAGTRSVDGRNSVVEFLSKPPGSGLDLSVEEALELWRSALFVAAALAAAAFVLGVYVFRRHNGARIGFTVAAGLLLLMIPTMGSVSLLPILLAFAAFGLWSQPARDWFAGRTPRPAPVRSEEAPRPQPPAQPQPEAQPQPHPQHQPPSEAQQPWQAPPPSPYPFGTPPQDQQYAQQPPAYPPQYGAPPQPSTRRPRSVLVAALLTWITSGLTAGVLLLGAMLIGADPDGFERELQAQLDKDPQFEELGITADQAMTYVWVMIALVVLWCLAAAVFAVFAFRRQSWARILLVVCAAGAALLSLIGIVAIVPVLTLVPAVVTIVLLFTRGANAWYSGRPQQPAQPRGGPW